MFPKTDFITPLCFVLVGSSQGLLVLQVTLVTVLAHNSGDSSLRSIQEERLRDSPGHIRGQAAPGGVFHSPRASSLPPTLSSQCTIPRETPVYFVINSVAVFQRITNHLLTNHLPCVVATSPGLSLLFDTKYSVYIADY